MRGYESREMRVFEPVLRTVRTKRNGDHGSEMANAVEPSGQRGEPTMERLPIRQGDVLLVPVESAPDDAKVRKGKSRLTIALGEVTGHHHTLVGDAELLDTKAGEVFARIMAPSDLTHQEHATITLEPGIYKYVPQREYFPTEIRRVLD
jgi:hypothetical protein